MMIIVLGSCYQPPDVSMCNCHFREYRDTLIVYDTTQIIYVGDGYASSHDCSSYDFFYVEKLLDTTKWLSGDSTQLIKAYYTKCWDAEVD